MKRKNRKLIIAVGKVVRLKADSESKGVIIAVSGRLGELLEVCWLKTRSGFTGKSNEYASALIN